MAEVRKERPGDEEAIRHVNEQAFAGPKEADLVDALRKRNAVALSMVALENDNIVGHILFAEVAIDQTAHELRALDLGPMAVLPPYQRRGIGSQLVRIGLDECRRQGHEIVVVVGYPDFYSRSGFTPAKLLGIECEFDVPDEAFMVFELHENALRGAKGIVRYMPEFRHI